MSDRRRSSMSAPLVVGLIMLGALALLAIVAPIFLSTAAEKLSSSNRAAPSADHWLGTDDLGRDTLARSLVATRLTVLMSLCATAIAVIAGTTIGTSIWLMPRRIREVVLRLIDSTVAFPSLILALVIAAILGAGARSAVIAIGVAGIPSFARIASNMTASVAQRDFVVQARLLGVPAPRILTRHLLPNIAGPLLVMIASSFALSLLEISSLSFVGLGVQSPHFDWGKLLAEGLPAIYSSPLQVVAPSVMLILAGVAVMLTGDGLANRFDPWAARPVRSGRRAARPAVVDPSDALVEVRGLTITSAEGVRLVKGIDFEIATGEILGLVGESGSGKSLTAMSLARLAPDTVALEAQVLRLGDIDLRGPVPRTRLARELGLVYQDPNTTFNPALRMGGQLTELARVHLGMNRAAARSTVVDALTQMRIREPERRLRQHPFQLSGGMLQRAVIASSLVADPRLIIADEPTTALDVTVQAEVLREMRRVNEVHGTAMLFISHDLAVVQAICDRVLVMRQGEIVEELVPAQLESGDVSHPYTRALLDATPQLDVPAHTQENTRD